MRLPSTPLPQVYNNKAESQEEENGRGARCQENATSTGKSRPLEDGKKSARSRGVSWIACDRGKKALQGGWRRAGRGRETDWNRKRETRFVGEMRFVRYASAMAREMLKMADVMSRQMSWERV